LQEVAGPYEELKNLEIADSNDQPDVDTNRMQLNVFTNVCPTTPLPEVSVLIILSIHDVAVNQRW